ncbi:MAG: FAD-dependent oxidoreductase [Treponema sp.]|nr:FAD-dependent oxidoreductase [Treponema sp.]
MDNARKIIIVGGVAGGATAAARLRRLDEKARIIMFERGEYISFANCGLPYYIGGEIKDKSALTLQTPESFNARYNIDVRILQEVTAIHPNKKTVSVTNLQTKTSYEESYDALILSPGAEPVRPAIPGIDSKKVFTLRNIPDTFAIKDFITGHNAKKAVVVGGGFIGVEMAENLKFAGLDVTLIEMADQIIPPLDYDMAVEVHKYIQSKGITLELSSRLTSIQETETSLSLTIQKNGTTEEHISADFLVMAIGVRPETKLAKDAGIALNAKGSIIVDEHMKTSIADIYAIGDAIEVTDFVSGSKTYVPLAGPANKQGRIAADTICGIESTYKGTQGSSILKVFDLTVASTGMNEKNAQRLGVEYDKLFTYSGNHASYYPGAVNMSIKTLFDPKDGKILGAQIIGYEGTDKRNDVLAVAIRAGMKASELKDLELSYAPPYGSAKDPVNMIGFAIDNILTGKVKQFHHSDVEKLPRDGSVQLLDLRTEIEYQNGTIPGFKNIPLDSLRTRLSELHKTKPIYVTCQIGLRGYVGARILSQNGFEVYNLSGGYRLYNMVYGKYAPLAPVNFNTETQMIEKRDNGFSVNQNAKLISIDACGLQCPGPIVKLSQAVKDADDGDIIEIATTDPAFASDVEGFCRRTGNVFLGMLSEKGVNKARIQKGKPPVKNSMEQNAHDNKNIIVFSGDLDKAIASFIIANAAAAMGRKVSMFFTFWGLNILRKAKKQRVKKDFLSKMFGLMMPRGSKKLGLSNMNMGGMGPKMIRMVMKKKKIASLEELISQAQQSGVDLLACSMSMDVMGIKEEELIPGVKMAGAAAMLANAEESDMSLFI